jgi:hypothetical protein
LQFEIHGYISPLPLPSISYSKPGRITQNGRGRCVPFGDNYKNTYAQIHTATHHFPSILRFAIDHSQFALRSFLGTYPSPSSRARVHK